jgi:hypothetical protein
MLAVIPEPQEDLILRRFVGRARLQLKRKRVGAEEARGAAPRRKASFLSSARAVSLGRPSSFRGCGAFEWAVK